MNGLGKPFREKTKKSKTLKIKVKLPHVYKKHQAIKRIFVQTPFSESTLKLRAKKFTLDFSLHFLFRRDQNHCSFDFKNHENV